MMAFTDRMITMNYTRIARRAGTRVLARAAVGAGLAFVLVLAVACSVSSLVDVGPPSSVVGEDAVDTYQGAQSLYVGAMSQFASAVNGGGTTAYVIASGAFSDELHNRNEFLFLDLDGRVPLAQPNVTAAPYNALQSTRIAAAQAIEVLSHYSAQAPSAYFAELYAAQGYTEIMLAELYCSGIPLTIVPFGGQFKLVPGSTTAEVFERAVAHFDTASTYPTTNAAILTMIRVGKARALVNLARYADAAAAVTDVQTADAYTLQYSNTIVDFGNSSFMSGTIADVQDREGINGMDWISAHDPRVVIDGTNTQTKYTSAGAPTVLADGIEARLIEAEADLAGTGTQWLTILNTLRTSGPQVGPGPADTTWLAGTGGVVGLRPLQDPVDPVLRVNLLFRERAFWLYLTGHRLGDMRRLIRQYHRDAGTVYPIGPFTPTSQFLSVYGNAVVAEIREQSTNPAYKGCFNLNA
jgi:hypothetical protein